MAELKYLHPLHWFVQTVLPSVYDDSLSYYEVLSKMCATLDEVIESTNAQNDVINEFTIEIKNEFQKFTEEVYADIEEFEQSVQQSVDGYLEKLKSDLDEWEKQKEQQIQEKIDEKGQELETKVDDKLAGVDETVAEKVQAVDDKLGGVDTTVQEKVQAVDDKLAEVDSDIEAKKNELDEAFDGFKTAVQGEINKYKQEKDEEINSDLTAYKANTDGDIANWKADTEEELNTKYEALKKEVEQALADSGVTGVKGNAEEAYRSGNVNLTPENIGAASATEFQEVKDKVDQMPSQVVSGIKGETQKDYQHGDVTLSAADVGAASTVTVQGIDDRLTEAETKVTELEGKTQDLPEKFVTGVKGEKESGDYRTGDVVISAEDIGAATTEELEGVRGELTGYVPDAEFEAYKTENDKAVQKNKEDIQMANDQIKGLTGGGIVTGVKGDKDAEYRQGNVNLTLENIGAVGTDAYESDKTALEQKDSEIEAKVDALTGLPDRVGALETSVEGLEQLPGKVTGVEDRLGTLETTVEPLPNNVTQLERDVEELQKLPDKVTALETKTQDLPEKFVTGVKGEKESGDYRTGDVVINAENVGAVATETYEVDKAGFAKVDGSNATGKWVAGANEADKVNLVYYDSTNKTWGDLKQELLKLEPFSGLYGEIDFKNIYISQNFNDIAPLKSDSSATTFFYKTLKSSERKVETYFVNMIYNDEAELFALAYNVNWRCVQIAYSEYAQPRIEGTIGDVIGFDDSNYPIPVTADGVNLYKGTLNLDAEFGNNEKQYWDFSQKYGDFTIAKATRNFHGLFQKIYAKKDEMYLLSAYVRKHGNPKTLVYFQFSSEDSATVEYNHVAINNLVTEEFQRFVIPGLVTSEGYLYARFECDLYSENDYIEICGLKLEKGYISTGWSPAPGDTAPEANKIRRKTVNVNLSTAWLQKEGYLDMTVSAAISGVTNDSNGYAVFDADEASRMDVYLNGVEMTKWDGTNATFVCNKKPGKAITGKISWVEYGG